MPPDGLWPLQIASGRRATSLVECQAFAKKSGDRSAYVMPAAPFVEEGSSSDHNPTRFEPYRRLAMDLISVKSAYHGDKLSRLAL